MENSKITEKPGPVHWNGLVLKLCVFQPATGVKEGGEAQFVSPTRSMVGKVVAGVFFTLFF